MAAVVRADSRQPARGENRALREAMVGTRDGCITRRRGGAAVWRVAGRSASAERRLAGRPGPRVPLGEITNKAGRGAELGAAEADPEEKCSLKRDVSLEEEEWVEAEYWSDILGKMLARESFFMPSSADFHSWMRARLNEWLSDVHEKSFMRPQTLFLTVNISDRYCARVQVGPDLLQLVGVAALLIAAKYEETPSRYNPPKLKALSYITDGAFSERDIVEMECKILANLEFEVAAPTAAHFLLSFSEPGQQRPAVTKPLAEQVASGRPAAAAEGRDAAAAAGQDELDVAWYLLELALVDGCSLRQTPSVMALAAWVLAHRLLGRPSPWTPRLVQLTGRPEGDAEACAAELRDLLEAAPQNSCAQAVQNKYRHVRTLLQES